MIFRADFFRGREAAERRWRSEREAALAALPLRLKIISNFAVKREDSVRKLCGAGRARPRGQRFIRRPQGKFDSEKGVKKYKRKSAKI